jgi:putative ABC transport system permease protein
MPKIRAFFLRLLGLNGSPRIEEDFSAELESHVALDTEAGIRSGLEPQEARRQALIRLGGAEQTRQAHRERRTLAPVEDLLHDLRYGVRLMARNPSFTVVAVLTLAIGIGATTAIFSAIKPILIDPLPYPQVGRLMMLWEMGGSGRPMPVSYGTFLGLQEQNRSLASIAVFKPWQPAIKAADRAENPERLDGQRVSADFFQVLGIAPQQGRDFEANDDRPRGPNVAILSDRLWRRRFSGDRLIIGKQALLDDTLYTVIGVMPASFDNVLSPSAELWAPLQYNPALPPDGREWGHHLHMLGRLKAGVSQQQARNELTALLPAMGRAHAKGYNSTGGVPDGIMVNPLQRDLTQAVRPALFAVLGAVILVLLIACANVANLMLARGARRQAEFAMRAALGASRLRVVRQLLAENLLLAICGCTLGLAIAAAGVRALIALSPPGLPRINAITIDAGVFLFAFAVTSVIGVVVGLVLTAQASRYDLSSEIQKGSIQTTGGRSWTRRVLVVAEVALAAVLLVTSGLLLRSMQNLFAVDPGFDSAHTLTMLVQASGHRYQSDAAGLRFFEQALEKVRQVPGVVSAGFTSQLPLTGVPDIYGAVFEKDHGAQQSPALRYSVTPGYLETMHIPLRSGRLLNESDKAGAPVAVLISQAFAQEQFAGKNPIGQHLVVGPDMGHTDRPWATIVGVVGNVKQESLAVGEEDAFYTTTAQWAWTDGEQSLVVRTRGDAATLTTAVGEAIWSVDGDVPVVRVATLENLQAATAAQRRFVLVLFEAFGVVALVLSAIGMYGVLAGSVAERTRELGVRAAFGATRSDILALIMRQGLALTAFGLCIGLGGALVAARALAAMLFNISWLDGLTYLAATTVLLGVSAVACFIPARRAASIEPMQALRSE